MSNRIFKLLFCKKGVTVVRYKGWYVVDAPRFNCYYWDKSYALSIARDLVKQSPY